ncbi:hypothetical protein SAMN04487911_10754 [Arenibacter nanhaiticus]|uniref:Uncharacterized protein n=2 Tax=Arenibacter nanhaiticus TaxID=558155 RepID=A0A1M6EUE8_9FLAO|nr:hypothetical protein SAMN04487911_10754 [Arenibacter nanhaiticus]
MILALMTSGLSCVERQDFDQYQDLDIIPKVPASLLYYEVSETALNNAPIGVPFSEDYNFDAFNEDFIADRIIEGSIAYEIVNTTSKPVDIVVTFLDENDRELDFTDFSVAAATSEPFVLEKTVAYNQADTQRVVKNISSIRIRVINRGDNTSQSSLKDPKVIFKSSAEFKVRLK